ATTRPRRRPSARSRCSMTSGTPVPALQVVGLRKTFGTAEVLKGIDLEVRSGELVFIIGPSGSGKSTLLRCCNRIEEPTAGAVILDGEDIARRDADLNRARQKIGM